MDQNEFYQQLYQTDLIVTFVKKTDGSTRVMKCTAHAPEEIKKESQTETRGKPEGLVTVYDIEAKDFRSFYVENITEIKPAGSQFGLLQG